MKRNPAHAWRRLEHAELIGDEVRVTGNYSLRLPADGRHRLGPDWRCYSPFLDPVFSPPGVYLAMSAAERRAAAGRGHGLARTGSRSGSVAQQAGEKRQRAGMARLLLLHLPLQWPRDAADVPRAAQYLAAAGTRRSSRCSPATCSIRRKVLWRLRLFKLIYAFCGLRDWRRWREEHRYRLAQARNRSSLWRHHAAG